LIIVFFSNFVRLRLRLKGWSNVQYSMAIRRVPKHWKYNKWVCRDCVEWETTILMFFWFLLLFLFSKFFNHIKACGTNLPKILYPNGIQSHGILQYQYWHEAMSPAADWWRMGTGRGCRSALCFFKKHLALELQLWDS